MIFDLTGFVSVAHEVCVLVQPLSSPASSRCEIKSAVDISRYSIVKPWREKHSTLR